ncbi:bacteriohemerythrin [Helicobacter saguini]|uniref:Bacteriohemerythrin n=1 Tax=Helicobacter saguini TaxID=1548018 RepID=A0A347W3U2_9HELI|nr:hemerythrin family protein [Helicobacter saguini]MWV62108.1 bacteriohemerythrin [Helicobacter saguini]MWV67220.1 bacteriohemerythrin [Helicobacter saguini]MWV69572.1 bacteriohemerythrin [Helicobacter saguini]MWV70877.1 bacteriohemerythrin [Helicobacter saguini]TLD94291.1 bacteriohemerythrin [Helicobacter saguini]
MLLAWDDKYSVNNYLIDEQHKKLFELANMADNMIGKQTNPTEIKKMLAALFEYMRTHFSDEEEYMRSIQYPMLESHQEKHKHIVSEMTNLVKNMGYDFKQKLVIIMEQWLLNHILKDDMGYARYVEEMNQERAKAAASAKKDDAPTNTQHNDMLKKAVMEPKQKQAPAKQKQKMHMYTCLCGKTYNIAPEIHAKIQAGEGVKCPDCTTFIKYITDIEA